MPPMMPPSPPPAPPHNPPPMPPHMPPMHFPVQRRFQVYYFNPFNYVFQRPFPSCYIDAGTRITLCPFYDAVGGLHWVTYINGLPYLVTRNDITNNLIIANSPTDSVSAINPPPVTNIATTPSGQIVNVPVPTTGNNATAINNLNATTSTNTANSGSSIMDTLNKKVSIMQAGVVLLLILLVVVIAGK